MIKTLLKSVGKYKKDSLKSPLFVSLEVIMEVIIPLLMARLIDNGIEKGNLPYIVKMGIALLISALFSMLFGAIAGKSASVASCGFAANLRRDMYYRVQDFSFSNIDKFSTASLVTRLTTDVSNVQMAFQMIIRIAIRSPFMLIFSLICSFTVNVKLSLVFLAAVPILGFGLYFIFSKAHPIFEKVFKIYDKLNRTVQENIRGVRVVKSFVREEHEDEKFKNTSKEIYDNFTRAEKLLAFNMPLMTFCIDACMILIAWLGAKAVVGNELTTGELMSLITYAMQILSSLMMLSMIFVMIAISRASAERICEVLVEESDIKEKENPVKEVKDGSISFKNVCFSYSKHGEKRCLDNINIDIKSGETIGIIGGTGSSKSTFVSLISRLYDADCGEVTVGGIDVRDYDLKVLRNAVSVVLQKNVLFSGTLADNLRWGDENATDEDLKRVCEYAQANGFISEMPEGYNTYIEQGGTNVSGGQKQRICIARALLKKPKILILDDSTSAVDTATDKKIREAFAAEIPDTTKLIIAQRIDSVINSDRIIVLDDGRISAVGTHKELLEISDIYREVYNSQTKGGRSDE